MNIEKTLNIIWDTMVWGSGFALFTQLIINSLYGFKFYWLINWFILVALYQTLSVKFSRADIMKAFSNQK